MVHWTQLLEGSAVGCALCW